MPFTDLPTVRKHLVAANIPETRVENVRITLVGTYSVALPHANLVNNSEAVKLIASDASSLETSVQLSNEDFTELVHKSLVQGSAVVAADRALTTIFTEELDYRTDYASGALARVAGGSIPNLTSVHVWYDRYLMYDIGADYVMDFPSGTIARTAGSSIPDGATVLVDYSIAQGTAEDSLIELVIVEATDVIVRSLRPGYTSSSTDQGLKTGACYLALAYYARGMSALMLTRNTGTDAHSRAKEWLSLAKEWNDIAWNVLAPFVTPHLIRAGAVE